MAKLKKVVTACKAQANGVNNGFIDMMGVFENFIQPLFPYPMPNLSVVITVTELERPTMLEIRVNSPDETLISKGDFGIIPDAFGIGTKIIDLENFVIGERGRYTIDLFEKVSNDKVKFIGTEELFMADYPPQRRMSDEEKEAILKDETVIKTVKTEFSVVPDEVIKVQISLDKNAPLEEGHIAIPEDDRLIINEDRVIDLTGIRRQMEWLYGRPYPKQTEELQKNKKESK